MEFPFDDAGSLEMACLLIEPPRHRRNLTALMATKAALAAQIRRRNQHAPEHAKWAEKARAAGLN